MLKIMTTVKLGWVSMETLFKQPQRLTAEMSEVSDWSQHLDQRLLVVNLPPLPRPLIPPPSPAYIHYPVSSRIMELYTSCLSLKLTLHSFTYTRSTKTTFSSMNTIGTLSWPYEHTQNTTLLLWTSVEHGMFP